MQNPYGYTAEQAEMLTAMMRMQQQHQQQQQPVATVNSVATGFAAPPAQPLYDESLLHQQMSQTLQMQSTVNGPTANGGVVPPAVVPPVASVQHNIPLLHLAGVCSLTNLATVLPLAACTAEALAGHARITGGNAQAQMAIQRMMNETNRSREQTLAALIQQVPYEHIGDISINALPALLKGIALYDRETYTRAYNMDVHQASQPSTSQQVPLAYKAPAPEPAAVHQQSSPTKKHSPSKATELPQQTSLSRSASVGSEESERQPQTPVSGVEVGQQLRKQIISVGKQPKAHGKRRKDMVSELFDSLTPAAEYFSQGNRRRNRPRSYKEDELQIMNTANALINATDGTASTSGGDHEHHSIASVSRARKRRNDENAGEVHAPIDVLERPVTPEAEIKERERVWYERMEERREKMQRRRRQGEEYLDADLAVIDESYRNFCDIIETIFDNAEGVDMAAGEEEDEIPSEFLITRQTLNELCSETKRLKNLCATDKLTSDMKRISKLLTILEKNVHDTTQQEANLIPFFDENDEDEMDETYRELLEERILRSCDAALTALSIMTTQGMPKETLIEDTIERCIQLTKQLNNNIVFPAHDQSRRVRKGGPAKSTDDGAKEEKKKDKRSGGSRKSTSASNAASRRAHMVRTVRGRMNELMACFAELVERRTVTETCIVQLSTLAVEPFFVEGVGDMQYNALRLTCAIFSKYERYRPPMLADILSSLHRLPSGKSHTKHTYRLSSTEHVQMITALMLHLVHSVVQAPLDRMGLAQQRQQQQQRDDDDSGDDDAATHHNNTVTANAGGKSDRDSELIHAYDAAKSIAHSFLDAFLRKCTARAEDADYRTLFELFLADLLTAVHKPEWPAAELCLTLLGNLLLATFGNKQLDMSLRVSALDYLGTITARLRKDEVASNNDADTLESVIQFLMNHTKIDGQGMHPAKRKKFSELGTNECQELLQTALVDYLDVMIQDRDEVFNFARAFSVTQWYRDAVVELDRTIKEQDRWVRDGEGDIRTRMQRAAENKTRAQQQAQSRKHMLRSLIDRHNTNMSVTMRTQSSSATCSTGAAILGEAHAAFVCKYLASGRAFSQSFDMYLSSIRMAIMQDTAVGLRTKAMKCLTQVIDADPSVLNRPRVRETVQARLVDSSGQVREATVHLIGDYILKQQSLIDTYYDVLSDRIRDTAVSVRKRVIKILREICEHRPDYDRIPEICMRIIRRMNDEDGIRKLVAETFHALWLQPSADSASLYKKVLHITDTVHLCKEDTLEHIEQLLHTLLKTADSRTLMAAGNIISCLVHNVLTIDERMQQADTSGGPPATGGEQAHTRLLACLSTLYLFSRTRPELLVSHAETLLPYLMLSAGSSGGGEQLVLVQVVNILERVIPLIDHPSESFVHRLENDLLNLCRRGTMQIVRASVACLSALVNLQHRQVNQVVVLFRMYFKILHSGYMRVRKDSPLLPSERPNVLRAIYLIGLLYRHFEFDAHMPPPNFGSTSPEKVGMAGESEEEGAGTWRKLIFRILIEMCRFVKDDQIATKAFMALGNFCATHGESLQDVELQSIYHKLMLDQRPLLAPHILMLKQQALANIETFLLADEHMMAQSYEEWQQKKDQEDIKEMNDVSSGMGSAVIQLYWNPVMQCYFSADAAVRIAAHRVIALTLQQGLVTPGSSIPTLVAMSTDPEPIVRHKAENLMKEIDAKYNNMVATKAVAGVRQAYKLSERIQLGHFMLQQSKLHARATGSGNEPAASGPTPTPPPVRGYRVERTSGGLPAAGGGAGVKVNASDAYAKLSPLYMLLRSQRATRRSLLYSMLRMFDDTTKLPLAELLYLADNLSMFPYQNQDEPLYVIHQADSVVSMSGAHLLAEFKSKLISVPAQPAPDEEDDRADHVYVRLPNDIEPLVEIINMTGACVLLLQLRMYLKHYYNFTEAKVQEYSPTEAAKVYEKAATRRQNNPLFNPMHTLRELDPNEQQKTMDHASPEFRWYISQRFCHFRKMLMSLDTFEKDGSDDDADKKMIKTGAADNADDDDQDGADSDAVAAADDDDEEEGDDE